VFITLIYAVDLNLSLWFGRKYFFMSPHLSPFHSKSQPSSGCYYTWWANTDQQTGATMDTILFLPILTMK